MLVIILIFISRWHGDLLVRPEQCSACPNVLVLLSGVIRCKCAIRVAARETSPDHGADRPVYSNAGPLHVHLRLSVLHSQCHPAALLSECRIEFVFVRKVLPEELFGETESGIIYMDNVNWRVNKIQSDVMIKSSCNLFYLLYKVRSVSQPSVAISPLNSPCSSLELRLSRPGRTIGTASPSSHSSISTGILRDFWLQ